MNSSCVFFRIKKQACLCSLEKIDVDEALAYFERLDNGDVSAVCVPSNEDEFVSSDSFVTPEHSVGNIPCGGAENIPKLVNKSSHICLFYYSNDFNRSFSFEIKLLVHIKV